MLVNLLELTSSANLDAAALLLRLGLAFVFLLHGYPKLKARGKNAGQVVMNSEWLRDIGIPGGFVLFAGVVEFFGGIALLLGFLTPVVAVLFALWMVCTTWLSITRLHEKLVGGYELDVAFVIFALALAAIGGGKFSVDYLLGI